MRRKYSQIKEWIKLIIGYIGLYFYNKKHHTPGRIKIQEVDIIQPIGSDEKPNKDIDIKNCLSGLKANRKKYTQAGIAEKLGVSQQFVSQIIKGNRPLPNRLKSKYNKIMRDLGESKNQN